MNLVASPVGIRLRSWVRRHSALRRLSLRLVAMRNRTYEDAFAEALQAELREGDVVWDVGANVGLYTKTFATIVGPTGKVVAIEPAPGCQTPLSQLASGYECVEVLNVALSDIDGEAFFATRLGPTSVNNQLSADGEVVVRVARGSTIIAEGVAEPDVVKIDVEGFEPEVLAGLRAWLAASPRCRALFVEVHFAALEARGRRDDPLRLQEDLRDLGFATTWLDASHMAARRIASAR